MANMSYCRFENTLNDLRDCEEHFDDDLTSSADELRARKRLLNLCRDITNAYEDE